MLETNDDIKINLSKYSLSKDLIDYFENKFSLKSTEFNDSQEENGSIEDWEEYCSKIPEIGAINILKRCYPQLNFPIETGIEKSQEYINAVLKGKTEYFSNENQLQLVKSEEIKVSIYDSFAGKIPILIIPNQNDFIKIVQCLLYKNNPVNIPLSMGALMVNGINNWERLNKLKKNWNSTLLQSNLSDTIKSKPHLYKDKIIILSEKPYSNVQAKKLNIDNASWLDLSHIIRLEHECTHLYTLKRYGSATNNLHDELIADYIGVNKALGSFNKEWMLEFLGLENLPKYRKGARLENYIVSLNLDSDNFENLCDIIYKAVGNISIFHESLGEIRSKQDQCNRINSLCETDLLDIASESGEELILNKYLNYSSFSITV